ncbi:MAG: hypothetical protein KC419_13425 [Anaerolineales bacterium]|nr:hypothetical protein [Anaerolineales bacterium]MCA9929479.1 hypothetical protein [Anaerolineales bacterium]
MKQQSRATWFYITLISLIPLLLIACTPAQGIVLGGVNPPVNQETRPTQQVTDHLIFAGKVTDPTTSLWLNDYLVTVYLNGKEVGRFVSALDKFENSGEGMHDGLFKVGFPNTYELTANMVYLRTTGEYLPISTAFSPLGRPAYLYSWFDELHPGTLIQIQVPDKQIEYTLKVSETPYSDLPAEIKVSGATRLDAAGRIWAEAAQTNNGLGGEPEAEETAVAVSSTNQPTTPKVIMQSEVKWTRTIYDYSGNRWDVWQQFVQPTNPDMSWEQFKEQVLIYNPHLAADSNVFYPDKLYLIPNTN